VREGLKGGDFFQVFGTSIPTRLPQARRATLELFSHPSEVLEEGYGHPEAFRQRGYSPFGGEKAVGVDEVDIYRQFWMSGNLEERTFGGAEDRHFDELDKDPDDLSPEFGKSVRSILREATHVARVLLRCFEELFGFEAGELVAKTIGADTVTRTLYYTSPKLNTVLAGEHDDINLITILSGDMWGLEVLINGEFHPVLIRPDCVLVNLGEMLNQIKGCEHLGRIRHRVVSRPGMHDPRIQFATFVHLLRDTVLLNNVRCGDWFAERIKEIQAK
jgi:isopenicillin N synthase-like dioxygenase